MTVANLRPHVLSAHRAIWAGFQVPTLCNQLACRASRTSQLNPTSERHLTGLFPARLGPFPDAVPRRSRCNYLLTDPSAGSQWAPLVLSSWIPVSCMRRPGARNAWAKEDAGLRLRRIHGLALYASRSSRLSLGLSSMAHHRQGGIPFTHLALCHLPCVWIDPALVACVRTLAHHAGRASQALTPHARVLWRRAGGASSSASRCSGPARA